MSKSITRIAAGAAALIATLAMTVPGSPAAAFEPPAGLTFYSAHPSVVVGFQATPDNACHPVPAEAVWALASSSTAFRVVAGYQTADCTGRSTNLNSFHSWPKGSYLSYWAPPYLVELP